MVRLLHLHQVGPAADDRGHPGRGGLVHRQGRPFNVPSGRWRAQAKGEKSRFWDFWMTFPI